MGVAVYIGLWTAVGIPGMQIPSSQATLQQAQWETNRQMKLCATMVAYIQIRIVFTWNN